MNVRSRWIILAVFAAIPAGPAATAQDVAAPTQSMVGGSWTPPVWSTSAAPAPSADGPSAALPGVGSNQKDINGPESECAATSADPPKRRVPLEASWDDGLHFDSTDDRFHLHIGGVGQIDTVFLLGPSSLFTVPGGGVSGVGNAEATQLRRAILEADGSIFGQFDYMVEYDFANASNENSGVQPPSFGNLTSSPAPLNIWMQVRDVPYLGDVRFGNQVKPIGMTNNTSAANLPFMERPDNNDAFYGPFDNGYA
ncbi:MAG TPA: porin, partial [Gemmataceae bacterium]|nr:porin [Gemmataceae bacterium]